MNHLLLAKLLRPKLIELDDTDMTPGQRAPWRCCGERRSP